MILLDAATKSLEVVLGTGASTQMPIVANWVDLSTSGTVAVSGVSDLTLVTNDTTPVTAVAGPAASTTRQVKFLSVKNPNSAAITVKVQLNNGGTRRILLAASLTQDDTLTYLDGRGWQVLNWNGELKESSIVINLTSQVTGVLPVANGGTGDSTLAAHGVLLGNGTSAVTVLAPDASTTKVLTSGGAAADPTWSNPSVDVSSATGTLPVNHGGSGATTLTGLVVGNGTSAFTTVTAPAGTVVGTSDTQTLTNKRVTNRITTIVSNATPTVNTDNCDCVTITALAVAITSMTSNLTGSPSNFDKLIYRIKDDGTGRAITWGASFVAKGVALPTTTVAGKLLTVGFIYDSVATTWGCVASTQEA